VERKQRLELLASHVVVVGEEGSFSHGSDSSIRLERIASSPDALLQEIERLGIDANYGLHQVYGEALLSCILCSPLTVLEDSTLRPLEQDGGGGADEVMPITHQEAPLAHVLDGRLPGVLNCLDIGLDVEAVPEWLK
jgi:hypothetical protein